MRRPKLSAFTGTAKLNAMIDQIAPAILELLADGVPRSKTAIVEALAGRYAEDDVTLTLIRLAVTEQVLEVSGKYMLGTAAEPWPGRRT
jgi:hypothetical protein